MIGGSILENFGQMSPLDSVAGKSTWIWPSLGLYANGLMCLFSRRLAVWPFLCGWMLSHPPAFVWISLILSQERGTANSHSD